MKNAHINIPNKNGKKIIFMFNGNKAIMEIEKAVYSFAGMYGGLQGIVGSSLPEIKSLNFFQLSQILVYPFSILE